MRYFVGLDWGGTSHAVCVLDEAGQVIDRFEIPHSERGLEELSRRLTRHAPAAELPISIERPSGLVVDTLMAAGHPVFPLHPNAVKAARPRYRAAAGKSDVGDAYLLADLLRTDGHRFRALKPSSDDLRALRALVRTRDDLVQQRVSLANQLRSLLESFWPGAVAVFADIDSPIALAFVHRYSTPATAEHLGEKRLASFLAEHGYCGRKSPAELLARLRAAPGGVCGEAEVETKGELVRTLAAVLERLVAELAKLTTRLEHTVAGLEDGRIVMSFPRAGRICAAQILAELGDERGRFPSEEHLAAEAGVAPVTHASGKSRGVTARWACNKRLKAAITCFADNSRHSSGWASTVYAKARARGCRHPHAVRILARAWVRVLWRAWSERTPYDPARHTSAAKLVAA
jgi:transposase